MYTPLKALQKPFNVSLEVTSQCNLDCGFCSAQLSKYGCKDLPTESVLKIIAKIADENICSIFLTGGEPFLRDDLPLIIKECLKRKMNVSVSTNGTMINRNTADMIASMGLDEIQISIHAPNEIHDKIVGVDGAIKRSFQGLRYLTEAGLRVSVAAVTTRLNYSLMPELARKIADTGATYFRVLRLIPHSYDLLHQVVSHADMQVLVNRLLQLDEELKDLSIIIHASPGFLDEKLCDPKEYKILHPFCRTCTAGKASMGILSNGDCVPCLELKDPDFRCGNLLNTSLKEIWGSRMMSLIRSVAPEKYRGKCGECELKWTCYSARCIAYNLHGDILGDDESCYRLQVDNLNQKLNHKI